VMAGILWGASRTVARDASRAEQGQARDGY